MGRRLSDGELVRRLVEGDADAWEQFVRVHGDLVYTFCTHLHTGEDEIQRAVLAIFEAFRADDFQRLRQYESRKGSLRTYVLKVTADLAGERLAAAVRDDPDRAVRAVTLLFDTKIRTTIRSLFPEWRGPEDSEAGAFRWMAGGAEPALDGVSFDDLYQEVLSFLMEDGARRLRAFAGRGSFSAYVGTVVTRRCIDLRRKHLPRRRPEAASLERGDDDPDLVSRIPDPASSPEDTVIESEGARATGEVIARLSAQLPPDYWLCLKLRYLDGYPPRDIAVVMRRPVKEIHRLVPKARAAALAELRASGVSPEAHSILRPQQEEEEIPS